MSLGLVASLCLAPAVAQTAPASPAAQAEAAATLEVQRFEVQGNTLLPPAVIEQRLAAFKGRLTLQGLRDAAAAVQDLYRRAGYGGVVAFVPEQKPEGGVVRIRVVEGKLARIDISDNQQFSEANIRASLPGLVPGRTPEVRLIDEQIQIANENPAKAVQVLLQPGDEPGTVAAKISVAEQPVQRFTARIDNTGSEKTGRWRAALGWQHANLAGADHVASFELQTAPEHTSSVLVASGNYRVPFYAQAMALDLYGAWSDVDSSKVGKVSTAAGDLEFSGRGYVAGLRGTAYLPRSGNVDQRVALGLEARDYRNECAIASLGAGACGSAGASVSVQPLALSYSAQTGGDVQLGGQVALHANLGLGGSHGKAEDFEAVRAGAKKHYTLLRASGQLSTAVAGWGVFVARFAGQASGEPLVPGELFGLGGAYSVRGYEERELGGDSGAQASLEFYGPNMMDSGGKGPRSELRALVFADGGMVSNRNEAPCQAGKTRCSVGSAGLGLRANFKHAQLRLDVARALRAAGETERGKTRAHAGLIVSY